MSAFEQFIEKYENANKKADALLKLGMIAAKQKDNATAMKFYNRVIAEHPETTAASEARKLLQ